MKKAALQLSFSWIFAIVVGIAIIALAIFGVTKLTGTSQGSQDVQTAKEIGILLNPLESGFETSKTTSISMPTETRIYNNCEEFGNFGYQGISTSEISFGKWSEPGLEVEFENRYIFSNSTIEGKKFNLFSKPFEFPFKVADLIYVVPAEKNYCFRNAPEEIDEEIEELGQSNFYTENCPENSILICFSGSCEITVFMDKGYVQKETNRLYFSDTALMYAAVFSDKGTYECQLSRLMKRTSSLAGIYGKKVDYLSSKGCGFNVKSNLAVLENSASNFEESRELENMKTNIEELKNKNDYALCRLW
jgi:hypothetical protein